ncbi:MAG: DUF4271 domain-containing protein [Bacteroidetes bacterium]|nr:DUF4271 domain-containing protein [Bacteroidota bacterium]
MLTLTMPFFGNGQHYFKKDLSSSWVVHDNQSDQYVPALDKIKEYDIVHFYLNLRKNKSNDMEVCNSGALSLFIEGSIIYSAFESQCNKYGIDSLFKIYKKDSVLVTFYNVESESNVTTSLLYPALGYTPPTGLTIERPLNNGRDFIIVALMIIIFLIILLKEKFQKFYEEFVSLSKGFNFRTRQSIIYKSRLLSTEVLTMLFIESLGLSLLITGLRRSVENVGLFWLDERGAFGVLLGNWITMALFLMSLQISYFFIIGLTNMFFNRKNFDVIQFFENLRLNYYALIIIFLLFFTTLAISDNALNMLINSIWGLFILLYFIRTLIIYLKLVTIGNIRKLHLFSYFCATEMIPAMVIVKVVFF